MFTRTWGISAGTTCVVAIQILQISAFEADEAASHAASGATRAADDAGEASDCIAIRVAHGPRERSVSAGARGGPRGERSVPPPLDLASRPLRYWSIMRAHACLVVAPLLGL